LLDGTDERGVIARMLQNLKHIHVEQKDWRRALGAVERLLAVRPGDAGELRDRGYIRAHLGQARPAIADLEHYLAAKPAAPDVDSVRGRVNLLRRQISEAN
jgi:regulator of sirC expression with transglutaminase-like and TPR domain